MRSQFAPAQPGEKVNSCWRSWQRRLQRSNHPRQPSPSCANPSPLFSRIHNILANRPSSAQNPLPPLLSLGNNCDLNSVRHTCCPSFSKILNNLVNNPSQCQNPYSFNLVTNAITIRPGTTNLAHCFCCKKNLNNIDLLLSEDYDFRSAVALLERWLKAYQADQAKK